MSVVSVCMCTYNGSPFIAAQIASILPQLGADDELIVSDDGSTDNTLQIISSFNDSRVKIFFNTNRHGPVGNFENALRHSSGEYIFLSDQDDVWLPGKVFDTCSLLGNYELVLSNCIVTDHLDNVLKKSFFDYRNSRKGFWFNLYKNSYMGCCMAFKREVLLYVLPIPHRVHMHDWWIGLLVEVKGRVVFYQEPLIKYIRHGGNASPTGESGYGFFKQLNNRFWLLLNIIKRLLV